MNSEEKIRLLEEKDAAQMNGGGEKAIEKQHKLGKMTARERLDCLLDYGTFCEVDRYVSHRCTNFGMEGKEIPADGVVTGYGKIDGRPVYVYSQDFTTVGGSMGEMQARKICKILDMAKSVGAPVIGLNDSGGARIQEGVDALTGYGQIFYRNSVYSGHIPQISLICGPCAGGASYSPALTDLVVMVHEKSQMFITGPEVVKVTTGEIIESEKLGGGYTHSSISGVSHLLAQSEHEAFDYVRKFLSYLPSCAEEYPPVMEYTPGNELRAALDTVIPDNDRSPYDMKTVIGQLVDSDSYFELQPLYAGNIITAFARIAGNSVGIVANQPNNLGGCLDINASDKGARFIQLCDAFNVPLINLVDVPGFLPGVGQEHGGIIRHGAKLLHAYSVAEVPKITVIIRKAFGGSYLAMCSKDLGADIVMSWPTALIAVMGAEGAANIIFRREIAGAENQEEKRKEMIGIYQDMFMNPYIAASRGYVDMVIKPSETRDQLIKALDILATKERKGMIHGNMPM